MTNVTEHRVKKCSFFLLILGWYLDQACSGQLSSDRWAERRVSTNGHGVDGVGVAVVVAVVVILSSIATGHNKDAPKTLPACNDAMLQRRLQENRDISQSDPNTLSADLNSVGWTQMCDGRKCTLFYNVTHVRDLLTCSSFGEAPALCVGKSKEKVQPITCRIWWTTGRWWLTLPKGWGPSTVRPSSSGPQLQHKVEMSGYTLSLYF